MSQLTQTAEELTLARQEVDRLKALLEEAKLDRDKKGLDLIDQMNEEGFKSVKTKDWNFAIVKKNDLRVADTEALSKYLKKNNLEEDYMVTKLDTIKLKSAANALMKDTGEVMDGMEPVVTEYVSIKAQKHG